MPMLKVFQVVRRILSANRLSNLVDKWNWPLIVLYWLATGLLLYHAYGEWQGQYSETWSNVYYVWESGLIFSVVASATHKRPKLFRMFSPLLFYAIIRICLQIMVLFLRMDINAKPIVMVLFILALTTTIYLTILEHYEGWKRVYLILKTKFLKWKRNFF